MIYVFFDFWCPKSSSSRKMDFSLENHWFWCYFDGFCIASWWIWRNTKYVKKNESVISRKLTMRFWFWIKIWILHKIPWYTYFVIFDVGIRLRVENGFLNPKSSILMLFWWFLHQLWTDPGPYPGKYAGFRKSRVL